MKLLDYHVIYYLTGIPRDKDIQSSGATGMPSLITLGFTLYHEYKLLQLGVIQCLKGTIYNLDHT